jgi:hypothetical protein
MLTVKYSLRKVIQTRGTIFYKSVQLLACADDIDINGRSEHDIKKNFIALKTETDATGLSINQEKPNTWLQTVKVVNHMLRIYVLVMIILKE